MTSKLLTKQFIWIIIGIPLLSYLALRQSFNLSLFGDDWEQLYFMWLEFDVRHSLQRFDIKSYLGPYQFSYIYLDILNYFFGFNSAAYFYTSYFCRILTTISIYFLVKFLTKEKLAAFLSSLVFIFSTAGLETTDWVFNLNTYIGIVSFNFAVIFYLKMRSSAKSLNSNLLFFSFLLTFTFFAVSTRMHGAIPFIILIDLVLTFILDKQKLNRKLILRIIIPVLILFFMINIGAFGKVGSGGFTDRFKLGLETASSLLQKGDYLFLFYLPGLIGRITLPDSFTASFVEMVGLRFASINFILISLILSFTTSKILDPKRNFSRKFLIFFGVTFAWSGFLYLLHKSYLTVAGHQFFSILVGGELLFLIGWLFIVLLKKYATTSIVMIFALLWLIAFSLIYWVFNPAVFFETTSRYLIMGAVGFAIFLGVFINFLLKRVHHNFAIIPLALLLFFLSINYFASYNYLAFLEKNRNSKLATSIWNSLTTNVTDLDIHNPTVFFLTSENPYSLHWNLVFGFPSHMGLTYKVPKLDNTPLPVSDYPTLLAYVKDGSPQKMNGRPIAPIPLDHVYAFHLNGDKLINQTKLIREKLKTDLESDNPTN